MATTNLLNGLTWSVINDDVMGGVSCSKIVEADDIVYFSGQLSLANNGGFASIRAQLNQRLGQQQRISITVKGDKRTYQFRLRTTSDSSGVAYKAEFHTKGEHWQTFNFSAEDFVASYRGKKVDNAPNLALSDVTHVTFLIADKITHPFTLSINAIFVEG